MTLLLGLSKFSVILFNNNIEETLLDHSPALYGRHFRDVLRQYTGALEEDA